SSARDFGQYAATQTGAAVPSDSLLNDMECGEGVDMATLELQGVQLDLLREIHSTGVPVIVVMINGRPMCINWAAENAAAIIEAWYPGQEGGHAIADVLFGDCNPGGRLPISVPRSAAQLPVYYSSKARERSKYADLDAAPVYRFAFGLSYTTFSYDNLSVRPAKIEPDGKATVRVDVTNTGARAGDEVVQLYIRDEVGSLTRPIRELKGFERISLQPGEKKTVRFTVGPEQLQFLGEDMKPVVEPGAFTIMVGGNQQDVLTGKLEVIAKTPAVRKRRK
ncbi:MAG TPA: glycoside hydrolase family 3 C-terminal domain-containing protein, partial [Planctomycetota bacterium]|nr:glycoside hydrolase family 3 C-terminal domain-containing protein [Planctomycetota bacterium]